MNFVNRVGMAQGFRRLYGDWFVGLREMPSADALLCTAAGVRCIFKAMTRVGVFPLARVSSCWT
jgi:hypothetical protein